MIDCATIRDLLPLYVDDVLAKESKALVSGHLANCENCTNEFLNMQSEIKKLHPDDEPKIDALKSVKRKIFKQKMIVALMASVLAFAFAVGIFWYVSYNGVPVAYAEESIWVERGSVEVDWDDNYTTTMATVLDLVTTNDFYGSYRTSRRINVSDTETEVLYIHLVETLSRRWWSDSRDARFIRLIGVSENVSFGMSDGNYRSLEIEVYYLIESLEPLGKIASMNDEDFYAQRNNGVLLWSGRLEQ